MQGDRRARPGRRPGRPPRHGRATCENEGIVWDPENGPGASYTKQHPVPFGEYVPVPRGAQQDHHAAPAGPARLLPRRTTPASSRSARPGSATSSASRSPTTRSCATPSTPAPARSSSRPTTPPTAAPASPSSSSPCRRLRAVEHGRAVVTAATSGISAIVAPDGTIEQRSDGIHAGRAHRAPPAARRHDARRPRRCGSRVDARYGGPSVLRRRRRRSAGAERTTGERGSSERRRRSAAIRPARHGVLVIIPTYNEAENIKPIVARVRAAVPEADILVADDNSPDGTGKLADELAAARRPRPRAAPQGQGRPRRRLPRRLPLGHRARLRRPGRDGRRRLAPARGAAPAAHRAQGRRPGARLPLGARRPGRQLAQVPRVPLPRRQHATPGCCSDCRSATSPAATGPSARRPCEGSAWTRSPPQGYCFQVDLARRAVKAGFHVVEVPDHLRRARARRQQDEPRHRRRGAVAGHRVGRRLAGASRVLGRKHLAERPIDRCPLVIVALSACAQAHWTV